MKERLRTSDYRFIAVCLVLFAGAAWYSGSPACGPLSQAQIPAAGASQPATAGSVLAASGVVAAIAVVRFLAQKVNWNRNQQRRESENHVPEI